MWVASLRLKDESWLNGSSFLAAKSAALFSPAYWLVQHGLVASCHRKLESALEIVLTIERAIRLQSQRLGARARLPPTHQIIRLGALTLPRCASCRRGRAARPLERGAKAQSPTACGVRYE